METESFCFWLQGYFELGGENLSPQQVQIIKDHLALVFNKVTPNYGLQSYGGTYAEAQKEYLSGYPPLLNQPFVSC